MTNRQPEELEQQLRRAARAFDYPTTPDIAGGVRERLSEQPIGGGWWQRRLAVAAAVMVLALVSLLSVPQVRAGVLEFLQIGVVRVFVTQPTPMAAPTETAPTPTPLASLRELAGETTLAEAREQVDFSIPLPAYPPALGVPDHVYVQRFEGAMVILVWQETGQPPLSLHILESGAFISKMQPAVVEQTSVNGTSAVWAEGPYLLEFTNGAYEAHRIIEGYVLIWEVDGMTYRLETELPLDEAVRIAESLR